MPTYIALLRGINVSGQKRVPMADLRKMLVNIGLRNVSTYIQSGNVVFETAKTQITSLEDKIKKGINEKFGFEVPVLVRSRDDIEKVLAANPFRAKEFLNNNKVYYVLLKSPPEKPFVAAFAQENYKNEQFHITDDCVYICCHEGYGKAKLNNNLVERRLKVGATTRNHRTMLKLLELSKVD